MESHYSQSIHWQADNVGVVIMREDSSTRAISESTTEISQGNIEEQFNNHLKENTCNNMCQAYGSRTTRAQRNYRIRSSSIESCIDQADKEPVSPNDCRNNRLGSSTESKRNRRRESDGSRRKRLERRAIERQISKIGLGNSETRRKPQSRSRSSHDESGDDIASTRRPRSPSTPWPEESFPLQSSTKPETWNCHKFHRLGSHWRQFNGLPGRSPPVETKTRQHDQACNHYHELKDRGTERNNCLWSKDLLSIPYHVQMIELEFGWFKVNKWIVNEQGKGTADYGCKLYPPKDWRGQWTVIKSELQLAEFLRQNPGILHKKEELTLNCVPYDPIPIILQDLRER